MMNTKPFMTRKALTVNEPAARTTDSNTPQKSPPDFLF